ncbi:hypothetical protein [Marinimicrobium sp. ABcell2]|uniref:hypothetical protein n=1 Tax=Marinimicrobium sp. ABcell2 TaxID=3069751 RepID=UPI0027B0DF51|nr:hypothetical protein [Marinimicrobium sp. ABcell2]MDQ2077459.1 hypothetical protein [Marinimicrobium sp. ABcell2]
MSAVRKRKAPAFPSSMSEWVAQGGLDTPFRPFRPVPGKETEKAFLVQGRKTNQAGYDYEATVYLPKSQCKLITDDFYNDTRGQEFWLVPGWLIEAKNREGVLLEPF